MPTVGQRGNQRPAPVRKIVRYPRPGRGRVANRLDQLGLAVFHGSASQEKQGVVTVPVLEALVVEPPHDQYPRLEPSAPWKRQALLF